MGEWVLVRIGRKAFMNGCQINQTGMDRDVVNVKETRHEAYALRFGWITDVKYMQMEEVPNIGDVAFHIHIHNQLLGHVLGYVGRLRRVGYIYDE